MKTIRCYRVSALKRILPQHLSIVLPIDVGLSTHLQISAAMVTYVTARGANAWVHVPYRRDRDQPQPASASEVLAPSPSPSPSPSQPEHVVPLLRKPARFGRRSPPVNVTQLMRLAGGLGLAAAISAADVRTDSFGPDW